MPPAATTVMNMVVSHWSANAAILAVCLVIAAAHLAGVRGLAAVSRAAGAPAPAGQVREVIAFDAGLVAVLLALVSPVAYWSKEFIWVRSLQDLLLAVVAPPLIVLGAPWLPLRRILGQLRRGLNFRPGGRAPAAGGGCGGPGIGAGPPGGVVRGWRGGGPIRPSLAELAGRGDRRVHGDLVRMARPRAVRRRAPQPAGLCR